MSTRWNILGLAFALAFASTVQAAWVEGTVEKIVDGDTIWVETDDGDRIKVRMTNSDTPELHLNGQKQPYAQAANDYLDKLIPVGTDVRVDVVGMDVYKRPLGFVYRGKRDINLEMVRSGWSAMYIYCTGNSCNKEFFVKQRVAEYVEACKVAVAQKEGIFNASKPLTELPFEFRLRVQKRRADKYVGNFTTKKYVDPSDYSKVPVCERVFFGSAKEAERSGYARK